MFLRIEKGSAVPISRQIADQIASLCASGGVTPGQRLPSVRELARDLAVNRLVDELRQLARQAIGLGLSRDELHELLAEAADGLARQSAAMMGEERKL
jgi:GntR family transcriptional regulator